jgi:PAS domain S-box-containing protein
MNLIIHILYIEDNPTDAQMVQGKLEAAGIACRITRVQSYDEFNAALRQDELDLVLADYRLPMCDGMSALRRVRELRPEIPFIFVSGTMGEEAAIEALTQGATDYVLKQNMMRLESAVRRAMQETQSRQEHKRMVKALADSEAAYRQIVGTANEGIWVIGPDTMTTFVNARMAEMLGCAGEEMIGRPLTDFMFEEDGPDHERKMANRRQGMSEYYERRFRHQDGQIVWTHASATPIFDAEHHFNGSFAMFTDITENKRAKIRLNEQLHFLQQLLDSIPIPVFYKNREGLYLGCNAAFEASTGLSRKDLVGKTVHEVVPKERADKHHEVDLALLRHPGKQAYEVSGIHKDGKHHDVIFNKATFVDANDCVAGIVATQIDITERKQAEAALAAREHEFRTLAESLPDNIVRYDREGRAVYINPVLEKLLGVAAADRIGMRVREFHTDESYEAYARAVDDALTGGENVEFEFISPIPGKEPIVNQVRMITERDEYGEVTGVLAIGRDITARKRAELERQANLMFFENMDRVNRAIQQADSLEQMMKDVLGVVLSIFDCDRAFLMYPCDPESPTWTSPMERNKPQYPGTLDLKLEIPMDSQVAETLRILLAADGPVTFGPGTAHALPEVVSAQFGIKCFMSMAIYPKTGSPWQFGIHQCAHVRSWTAEEKRMFEAIGRRLGDSLTSLLSHLDLLKSEKFLDNVVEHIPDMIFVKDAQTLRFVRFNKAGEQLVGYPREELIGKTDYDFFPKEEADYFTAKDRWALDTRELVDIPEESIRNRHHEERLLHTKKIPILDETGAPQYLLGISEDITDRKQAEASIRKLSQVIEQSPVSIVITDVEGRIEFVNAKFTQITGYTFAEALGQTPRILKSGETPAKEYSRLWKTIRSGGVWQGEFRNRKKNGELFWEHATIAPVRNADNVITHYVAVKEDITERKELEAKLRQSQKMEAVGQLAGGVAHDFNNMLGVIIGHAELAMNKAAPDDSLRKHLEKILEAGHRSSEITRQLLAFARKQTVMPQILELNNTVEGMLKLLRRVIGEDIDIAWLPKANLWRVKMDPSQIDQILVNLCVNARDAIAGVGKVTIETQNAVFDDAHCAEQKGFAPGEYVMLAVSDNGSGMDKRTLDKIFEPFFTTKGIGKGTGLGLATVYGIVKQNAGFINAYSEPGRGSSFKIYLPRHAAKTEHISAESPVAPAFRGHETILLVEDESIVLDMAKLMLENLGYAVLTSSTPREAIRIASENSDEINLLITDVVMPEMNGRDLAKNLTSLYPELKCLFMSGYTGNVIAHQSLLEEGVDFIQKPFSIQQLSAKVREALDSK